MLTWVADKNYDAGEAMVRAVAAERKALRRTWRRTRNGGCWCHSISRTTRHPWFTRSEHEMTRKKVEDECSARTG